MHEIDELTHIVSDVVSDPTLPRSEDHPCPKCNHREAYSQLLWKPTTHHCNIDIVISRTNIDCMLRAGFQCDSFNTSMLATWSITSPSSRGRTTCNTIHYYVKLPGSTSHWLFSAGKFTALTPLYSPPPVVVQRGRLVTQPPPRPANTTHLPLTYIRLQSSLAFVCLTISFCLKTDMELRFEDLTKLQIPDWILDPFSFEAVDKLDNSLQTEFLDLKYDCEAKIIFKQSGYELGWVKIMDTYPQLWGKTEPLLISFPSTYLVEKGFSSVVQLLTKQRNKLDICLKGDLRLNLTNIKPDIQALTEIHQAQGSH
uniref:Uncharacterized protein n=1 Tax=Timema monikensis TaxID=170555 RepID=A0A7R9DYQ0_9NEOP|nr:unnamed protein product [Timema monikensis]